MDCVMFPSFDSCTVVMEGNVSALRKYTLKYLEAKRFAVSKGIQIVWRKLWV